MKKNEVAMLLESVRVVDNRKVSEALVDAWHDILKDMKLEIAREALRLARRDPNVDYLEPRHLISWAREARFNLQPEDEPAEESRSTQPKCREHGEKITECAACCRALAKFAEEKRLNFAEPKTASSHGELIHQHATANLYA